MQVDEHPQVKAIHGTNRLGSNADADACGIGYISGYYVATGEMPDFIPAE